MFRLIEWKLKKEWKMGYFTSIDFVSCAATIDMYKQNQTPLYARHIIRTEDNPILVPAVRYLYEKWLDYGADAIDMKIRKKLKNSISDNIIENDNKKLDLTTPFIGKLTRVNP